MEKIKVYISPKSTMFMNNGQFLYSLSHADIFLKSFTNIVELKYNNKTQETVYKDSDIFIVTLQEIKNDLQLKYWKLNPDINIATAFSEVVINKNDYDKLYDMYSLFKLDETYLNKYVNLKVSDNFKYNELRRLFQNGHLILN